MSRLFHVTTQYLHEAINTYGAVCLQQLICMHYIKYSSALRTNECLLTSQIARMFPGSLECRYPLQRHLTFTYVVHSPEGLAEHCSS